MSPENKSKYPKEVFLMPDGAQGSKVGLQVESEEKISELKSALKALPEKRRKTTAGIMEAARAANVPVIDL